MYVEFQRLLVYLHVYGIGFIHYFIFHCLDPWHVWILILVSFSFLIYSKFPLLAKAHGLKPEMFFFYSLCFQHFMLCFCSWFSFFIVFVFVADVGRAILPLTLPEKHQPTDHPSSWPTSVFLMVRNWVLDP